MNTERVYSLFLDQKLRYDFYKKKYFDLLWFRLPRLIRLEQASSTYRTFVYQFNKPKKGYFFHYNRPALSVKWIRTETVLLLKLIERRRLVNFVLTSASRKLSSRVMLMLSSTQLTKELGLTMKHRRTTLVRLHFIYNLRRILLLSNLWSFNFELRSVMSDFKFIWARLNTPLNEAYIHPLWTKMLFLDFSFVQRFQPFKLILALLEKQGMGFLNLEGIEMRFNRENLETEDFTHIKFSQERAFQHPTQVHTFFWKCCLINVAAPFGLRKIKKMRSIKRRMLKKLVSTVQRRWWIF